MDNDQENEKVLTNLETLLNEPTVLFNQQHGKGTGVTVIKTGTGLNLLTPVTIQDFLTAQQTGGEITLKTEGTPVVHIIVDKTDKNIYSVDSDEGKHVFVKVTIPVNQIVFAPFETSVRYNDVEGVRTVADILWTVTGTAVVLNSNGKKPKNVTPHIVVIKSDGNGKVTFSAEVTG